MSMYRAPDGLWRLAFRVANMRQHQVGGGGGRPACGMHASEALLGTHGAAQACSQ